MKKILMLVMMMTLALTAATAQTTHTVEGLINAFSSEKGVEKTHLGKALMRLGAVFLKGKETNISHIAKGINSVTVLDLDNCAKDVKQRFTQAVDSLDDAAYSQVLETNNGDDHVRILGKPDGYNMRDVVVISIDDDDCTLVFLEGKIKGKDIKKLLDD